MIISVDQLIEKRNKDRNDFAKKLQQHFDDNVSDEIFYFIESLNLDEIFEEAIENFANNDTTECVKKSVFDRSDLHKYIHDKCPEYITFLREMNTKYPNIETPDIYNITADRIIRYYKKKFGNLGYKIDFENINAAYKLPMSFNTHERSYYIVIKIPTEACAKLVDLEGDITNNWIQSEYCIENSRD
jgi:hypothetical protein